MTPAAEILAASDDFDSLIPLRSSLEQIRGTEIEALALVDSKDLYRSLSTQRNLVDLSVRVGVNCIGFVFETALSEVGWIPGCCSPADLGTKPNSVLTDAVMFMFASGKVPMDLSKCETEASERILG